MNRINFEDLENKVCVITGGAGVIGSILCQALANTGIRTAILDIDGKAAKKLASSLKSGTHTPCIGLQADVLSRDSLESARKTVIEEFGSVDFLINGAGGNAPEATTEVEWLDSESLNEPERGFFGLSIDGFDKVFALNFKGTLLPSMVFGETMIKNQKGVILNVSSMNAFRPLTRIPAYSAAKASINNFTQWLSVHLAKTGIRVNAIAPGFFLTNQNRFLLVDKASGKPTQRGEKIINSTPMGRYGKVEELQGTVLYLLSDISGFVTGICIPVDGGYNAFGGV